MDKQVVTLKVFHALVSRVVSALQFLTNDVRMLILLVSQELTSSEVRDVQPRANEFKLVTPLVSQELTSKETSDEQSLIKDAKVEISDKFKDCASIKVQFIQPFAKLLTVLSEVSPNWSTLIKFNLLPLLANANAVIVPLMLI